MSLATTAPGLMRPTQVGMLGSNPKDSAIQYLNNMNQKQANLANAVGGKKHKNKHYGGAVVVPQVIVPYPVSNGPGQDPNSQVVNNSITGTQGAANRNYDSLAMNGGRSRRRKRTNKNRRTKRRKTHRKRK